MLEMARRGLLSRGSWSAGSYPFCPHANLTAARGPKAYATAGPLAYRDNLRLLSNDSLVGWLCSQLPRVLDVNPTVKTSGIDFGTAAGPNLWPSEADSHCGSVCVGAR